MRAHYINNAASLREYGTQQFLRFFYPGMIKSTFLQLFRSTFTLNFALLLFAFALKLHIFPENKRARLFYEILGNGATRSSVCMGT